MLYDNALLLRVGAHLVQATRDDEITRVCGEIVEWVGREMTSPKGGFYSTLDADSEGEEGKFYLWSVDELREAIGTHGDADALIAYWGVTAEGNFEGANILHVTSNARPARVPRQQLYDWRAKRVWPARDEKILAAWNGLMLRALAECARALDSDHARALATNNGEFLFTHMVRDGRVSRTHKDGVSRIPGFLEDYAAVGLGALSLYELTFDRKWLDRAHAMADATVQWFWDEKAGAFFDTPSDHERLLTRPRDITDNAMPSGTSLACELLLRLGDALGEPDMVRRATFVLETVAEPMARYPLAFGHALTAADMPVYGATELALLGRRGAEDLRVLSRAAGAEYVPTLVLAGGEPDQSIALLADREMRDGRATAYVCRGFACQQPTTDPAELRRQLRTIPRERSPGSSRPESSPSA